MMNPVKKQNDNSSKQNNLILEILQRHNNAIQEILQRLTKVETKLEGVATKEDLSNLRASIYNVILLTLSPIVAVVVAAAIKFIFFG